MPDSLTGKWFVVYEHPYSYADTKRFSAYQHSREPTDKRVYFGEPRQSYGRRAGDRFSMCERSDVIAMDVPEALAREVNRLSLAHEGWRKEEKRQHEARLAAKRDEHETEVAEKLRASGVQWWAQIEKMRGVQK